MAEASDLRSRWIHLGRGATATPQPATEDAADPMAWYESYAERTAADGAEGRLVALHEFSGDWEVWEMHPVGSEVVVCTAGEMTLIQQTTAGERHIALTPGCYAINNAGVWHTADVPQSAQALFITAGQGTQHRPR